MKNCYRTVFSRYCYIIVIESFKTTILLYKIGLYFLAILVLVGSFVLTPKPIAGDSQGKGKSPETLPLPLKTISLGKFYVY